MAKKQDTIFVCQECGHESPKWMGRCDACGAWSSFVEEKVYKEDISDRRSRSRSAAGGLSQGEDGARAAKARRLSEVRSGTYSRIDTGIGELNRVLGGGIVQGSLNLISGEPGIGKSTIIIQAAANIAGQGGVVLYVSGEESEEQIKIRADRVCGKIPDTLYLLAETDMDNISRHVAELRPSFLIIDSIQTMYVPELESAPGSVSQVRACGNELMRIGKADNVPVFIVAHVTKSGDLAGPKIIEHLVDGVLNFTGERDQDMRILRSYKNRFGTTSEIGAFEMTGEGLREIENVSKSFIEGLEDGTPGSVASAVYEGTRPLLLEIQALTSPANAGFARRTGVGIDHNRLSMIIAVLERKVGISLSEQDVYVNVVGGIRPDGTGTDLAVALAICSAYRDVSLPDGTLAIGEIGLTGNLRGVRNAERIAKEAQRLGFRRIMVPEKNADKVREAAPGLEVAAVSSLRDAVNALRTGRN